MFTKCWRILIILSYQEIAHLQNPAFCFTLSKWYLHTFIYMTTLSVYDAITLQWHQLQVSAPVKINNIQTNHNKYLTISHLWIRIGKVCRSILRRHMIEEKSSNHEGNRHTLFHKGLALRAVKYSCTCGESLSNTPPLIRFAWNTLYPTIASAAVNLQPITALIFRKFQRLQSEMVNVCNNYLAVLTKLNQHMPLVVCSQVATCVCPYISFQKYCHIYALNL